MKILVYGAGAVGGYLGAKLLQSGNEVVMVARDVTVSLVSANGLTITEEGRRSRTQPTVLPSLMQAFQADETYDLIILGMKSYDLNSALDSLVAFCPDPKMILTTQNGIGIEAPFIEQFGAQRVIAGSVTIPLRKETTDHIVVEKSDRGLALAPTLPKQKIKEWRALFQKAGLTVALEKEYQAMKWSKVLLNIVANATSAIINRRPGLIYKSDILFDIEVRMLTEVLDVMQAENIKLIELPGAPTKRLAFGVRRLPKSMLKPIMANIVSSGRGEKMPSFQIDLTAGKGKNEVIFHNGAVARVGKAKGVPTPVNAALSDTLMKLTRDEFDWREFDGRPKRLALEVRRYAAALNAG